MFSSLYQSLFGEFSSRRAEEMSNQATPSTTLSTGRRADRQIVNEQPGPFETIALSRPHPHDPNLEEWDMVVERVPVISMDNQEEPLSHSTMPENVVRGRILAQLNKVAADMRELSALLAESSREWWVSNNMPEPILEKLRALSTEMGDMVAGIGGELPPGMSPLEENIRRILENPAEVSYQAFVGLQVHSSAAMSGIQSILDRLMCGARPDDSEFDPNMQRSFAHMSHVFEEPESPATERAKYLDHEDDWVCIDRKDDEDERQQQQPLEEAEEERQQPQQPNRPQPDVFRQQRLYQQPPQPRFDLWKQQPTWQQLQQLTETKELEQEGGEEM